MATSSGALPAPSRSALPQFHRLRFWNAVRSRMALGESRQRRPRSGDAAERAEASSPVRARNGQGGVREPSEVTAIGSGDADDGRGSCFLDDEAVPGAFLHHDAPRIAGPVLSQSQELQALAFGAILACLSFWALYSLDFF